MKPTIITRIAQGLTAAAVMAGAAYVLAPDAAADQGIVANDSGSTSGATTAPSIDNDRRVHKPITVSKPISVSTPLLLGAVP